MPGITSGDVMNVYFAVSLENPMRMKIGKADKPDQRIANLQTGSASRIELLAAMPCKSQMHAKHMERLAHSYFKYAHLRGEWFKYHKRTKQKVLDWIARH